jgi:endogenous inhibitor of DNA gyrase (YacG/DUF329 family)
MPDTTVRMRRCVICGENAAPRNLNKFAPFCSDRCKMIDLSRWLNEEYVVSAPLPWLAPDAATVGTGGESEGQTAGGVSLVDPDRDPDRDSD